MKDLLVSALHYSLLSATIGSILEARSATGNTRTASVLSRSSQHKLVILNEVKDLLFSALHYSLRSATIGSILEARSAGTVHATTAVSSRQPSMANNTTGSNGLVP